MPPPTRRPNAYARDRVSGEVAYAKTCVLTLYFPSSTSRRRRTAMLGLYLSISTLLATTTRLSAVPSPTSSTPTNTHPGTGPRLPPPSHHRSNSLRHLPAQSNFSLRPLRSFYRQLLVSLSAPGSCRCGLGRNTFPLGCFLDAAGGSSGSGLCGWEGCEAV